MQEVLDFLADLAGHNDREWFEAHRKRYEKSRTVFKDLTQELIFQISQFDPLGNLSAKECMFRIYRDVRFSKDKSPYKTNMGAYIARGGRKTGRAGYYIHVEPGASFLGGGIYRPGSEQLANIRAAIADDAGPLRAIIQDDKFVQYFGSLSGDRLKTAPRGYSRDHPDIDLLRYKDFVVGQNVTDEQVVSPNFINHTLDVFRQMKPLNDWLNAHAF